MKCWLFILLKTLILANVSIKDRFLHIKVDNVGTVKLKDHVKYILKDKKSINIKKTIYTDNSTTNNIYLTINKPNRLSNISILKIPVNSTNYKNKLKKAGNKSFINEIQFNAEISSNDSMLIVTYEYTLSNFIFGSSDRKEFKLNLDKFEDPSQLPYNFEIKLDFDYDALFGLNSPAQFILENEENYKWKTQKEKKEFHVFIQYMKKTNKELKGIFVMSNFDRNDKFSYSHSHKDFWDFKDWYHHHGHSNRNFQNESSGHMMLDMGFAFILLFCIFGCIFYPIVCHPANNIENLEEKSSDSHLKKENVI